MKKIFDWWNSLKTNDRRLFDLGVLCSPFHIGLGLTFYLQQPAILAVLCVLPVFFVLLNWKYSA
jgi:hypothetical protein